MASQDFVRQLDDINLARRRSLWDVLHLDLPLLCTLTILIGFGLMVLYSATDGNSLEMRRQVIFICLAVVLMLVTAQVDVRRMKHWAPWMYLGSLVLLIAVLFIGVSANGAQRWLDFPVLPRFQPSEIMKLVLPFTVATYLSRQALPPKLNHVLLALVLLFAPAAVISLQPDLGTALLIAVSGIFVLLLAGVSKRFIYTALAGLIAVVPLMWIFYLKSYQKQRVLTLLNPASDPLGAGWNIIQSKTAIGSGGFYGKGWLNGVQSRLDFLPEGQTDFIVAVLAEEFGLLGMLFLLLLYIVIIGRGLYIGAVAQDTFCRLLAGSITLTFFVYVFVNIGMVTGLLPVVGVPLPMVSLGGTSIVTLMIGFGVLMSIHTHKRNL